VPRRTALGLAGLVAAALGAYLPACWSSFVADDYVLRETVGRVESFTWAFSHNYLGLPGDNGGFYRPLWVLWNTAIDRLFDGDVTAFHAASLFLFAVVTVEVWALARRVVGPEAAWIAGFAFALYPRHAESVAWVSGNTDLVPAAIGLGALLCAGAGGRLAVRAPLAAGLAAAAALAKEVAFVLPFLALILAWLLPRRAREPRWAVPAAMLAAQLGVLLARTAVVGGLGGYREYPWTPLRAGAALLSYLLAGLTPSQLPLGRHPWLVVLPALVLALAVRRVMMLRGDRARLRVVVGGTIWFALSLLPSLNLVIDLNAANGERLLFLPSVGLAFVFAALAADLPRRILLGAGILAAILCVQNSANWIVAGRIADRVRDQALALSPPGGELVVLTIPESYRTGHVFLVGLDRAVSQSGGAGRRIAWCIPVELESERAGEVRVSGTGPFEAETSWRAPFDFPVFRDPSPLTADCSYSREGGRWPPGLGRRARASAHPARQPVVYAYFDGKDLRRYEGQ
jgi:hypothetical protein